MRGNRRGEKNTNINTEKGQREKRESIKKIMKIKHRAWFIVIPVSREACNELKEYGCFLYNLTVSHMLLHSL